MADRQQFILNLKHRPAFGRDDFFVAECNQEALSFIDLWPNWPGPLVWLYGPPGCGKSHLAAVWQEQSGANQLDQAQIISESISISRNFSCFSFRRRFLFFHISVLRKAIYSIVQLEVLLPSQ